MKNIPIHFEACASVGEKLWISEKKYNALYKMNIKNGNIKYCGEFPNENPLKKRLHYGNAIEIDSKLYFVPLESSYIHIYDIKSDEFSSVKIADKAAGFSAGFNYENSCIYFISTRNTDITKYNIKDNTIENAYLGDTSEKIGYAHGSVSYKENLYMIPKYTCVLKVFDMKNMKMSECNLANLGESIEIIGIEDYMMFLINTQTKKVYVFNLENKSVSEKNIVYNYSLNSWHNNEIIVANNYNEDIVYIYNMRDDCIIPIMVENKKMDVDPFIISTAFTYKNDILFVNKQDNSIYSSIYGCKKYDLCINEKEIDYIKEKMSKSKINIHQGIMREQMVFGIKGFIDNIVG